MNHKDTLNLVLEIEGCIRILQAREDAEALALLRHKLQSLCDIVNDFGSQSKPEIQQSVVTEQPTNTPIAMVVSQEETFTESEEELEDTIDEIDETSEEDQQPSGNSANQSEEHDSGDVIRLENVISQRELVDFAKAFTINDKFRFSRELFDNNQAKFSETVNLVAKMQSLDEAYDYFLNDLNWDADDPAVSDFLVLVANHFNAIS